MAQTGSLHRRAEPGWFRWAALATLVWMVLGIANYLFHVTVDPATLPADQQALMAAVPDWMVSFFAVAVWVGLPGGVLLVMRRKGAEALLIGSLAACAMQFSAYFLHAPLREQMTPGGMVVPVLVLVVTAAVTWLAHRARVRGWLK